MVLALASEARAADNTIAVLGIEATDGAPDSVAALLTDALRQRASGERGLRVVPGKDLIEVKLIFSCPDEAPSCMADAAKTLGASKMIFGSVKRAPGDSYVVTLKLLDVGRKAVDSWVAEQITKAQAMPGLVRAPVQKWFAQLTGQSATGTVRVRGDVPGTAVALDGGPVGVIGSDDLVLSNIAAGRHELLASKPGYPPVRREVSVVANQSVDVAIEMANTAAPVAPPVTMGTEPSPTTGAPGADVSLTRSGTAEPTSNGTIRAASWTTLAASLVSFGLAIKFALDVNSINSDLDPWRRFPCTTDVSKGNNCDASGMKQLTPLNAEGIKYVNDLQSEGRRFEKYQYIALGAGSVLAITSGILFYYGYLADENGSVALGRGRQSPRLSLLPLVGGGTLGRAGGSTAGVAGGMLAHITF